METVQAFKEELLQALRQTNAEANFATSGTLGLPLNPCLVVDHIGVVGFPLSSREAKVLISQCRKSPVGKGTKTLHDESVRKSWELQPSQFKLTNRMWDSVIDEALTSIYHDLGLACGRKNIRAELYKLLIYEKGAFFKPHQDSEKTPGMFGTLVISLPSAHEGGSVVLTHNGNRYVYDSSRVTQDLTEISFGAWYSNVFHEVRPLTSGYRVVLTYNLVQDQGTPLQYATDGERESRLSSALSRWGDALRQYQDGWPPYIIHKLEHMYSESAIGVGTLKGNDLLRIQSLTKVCEQLGFELYFATYEKTVHKDDDTGSEVYDREECIINVMSLDGTALPCEPDFDTFCHLQPPDEADEGSDYDESEHEGWTGNEGSPARYWYRDTVIVIVPKSRKLTFLLSGENKGSTILKGLSGLRVNAAHDESAKEELRQYCHFVVSSTTVSRSSFSLDKYYHALEDGPLWHSCMKLVVLSALENNWSELYGKSSEAARMDPKCLEAVGKYIGAYGVHPIQKGLDAMICEENPARFYYETNYRPTRDQGVVAKRLDCLQQIKKAFEASGPADQRRSEFCDWFKGAVKAVTKGTGSKTRADMHALAQIAKDLGEETVDHAYFKIDGSEAQLLAQFAIHFHTITKHLPGEFATLYLGGVLDRIWDDFHYTDDQKPSAVDCPEHPSFRYTASHRSNKHFEEITSQELTDLLELTRTYRPEGLQTAVESMRDAIGEVSGRYFKAHLMDFINAVLHNLVPALIVEDAPDLFDAVSSFIETALRVHIEETVGKEPQAPRDWELPGRGCSSSHCTDCKLLEGFMRNPSEQVCQVHGANKGRHLQRFFMNADAQLEIQVIPGTKPQVWQFTKTHQRYAREHADWVRQHKAAVARLKKMAGKNGEQLRKYLGNKFNAFMTARVEKLPPVKTEAQRGLLESSGSKSNRKRPLEGAKTDNAPKRVRVKSQEVIVID